jgi:hypothetical protein
VPDVYVTQDEYIIHQSTITIDERPEIIDEPAFLDEVSIFSRSSLKFACLCSFRHFICKLRLYLSDEAQAAYTFASLFMGFTFYK